MPDELLSRSFAIRGRDFERAGEASTEIKSLLKELEIDPAVIRRTVVIAFEAEMNIVMYADEGTVTFVLTDEDIGVADRGPGIPDLDLALQEGWSTATDEMREMGFGFGMGLPNIRRNSDEFSVKSQVGEGTVVSSRISLDGAP